ncbi:hypothetical protein [Bosea sp. LjRoot237]|uniref:hypothetical protein n=1 Tax=Bosea sp. LjRoot237 TaxID=3342292 RepID=UPI003ECF2025
MSFGNASITIHLLRGLLGILALLLAAWSYKWLGLFSLLLLPVALWALKGCPLCWTVGLFETLISRKTRHETGEGEGKATTRQCPDACTPRQTQ